MTWVIWRQYRTTIAIAGSVLAGFAVLLLVTGLQDAARWHTALVTGLQDAARWHTALVTCAKDNTCTDLARTVSLGSGPMRALTVLTLALPLLFGMFWGGPAVARERETGTIQFAWTQSVTRQRWLTVKTGWLLLAGAAFGGTVAGIVTWWYAPVNALHQAQFTPVNFDVQGIVPIGYAVFAVALGITAGTLIGRSLPALAITGGVFLAVRMAIEYWVRVHYLPAVTTIYSVTQNLPAKGARSSTWAARLRTFAGEGANLAMFDGAELGKAIAAHPDDVEAALAEYELALFPRSAHFAAESDKNHKLMFGDGTPDGLLALLTGQEPTE